MNTITRTDAEVKFDLFVSGLTPAVFGVFETPAKPAPIAFHKISDIEAAYELAYQAVLGGRAMWLTSKPVESTPTPTAESKLTPAETAIVSAAVSKAIRATGTHLNDQMTEVTPAAREAAKVAYAETLARVLADRTPPAPPAPKPGDDDVFGMATLGLMPICGGSPQAERVIVFETRFDAGTWTVTREGKPVFRARSMAYARAEMSRQAKNEATCNHLAVRVTTRFQDGTSATAVYAPGGEVVPPVSGGSPCEADIVQRRAEWERYGNRVGRVEPRGPWDLESHDLSQCGSQLGHHG